MIQTRIIMGMPVILEVVDKSATTDIFEAIFEYFEYVDRKFSTYKPDSEISMINRNELTLEEIPEIDIFDLLSFKLDKCCSYSFLRADRF